MTSTDVMFSVVIPVLDGADGLRRTVEALRKCEVPGGVHLEVVISDDGSTDGSRDLARSLADVVVLGDHAGPGGARNRGADAASGEVLAFLDCGDEPRPSWVRELVEPFRSSDVGIATCSADARDLEAGTTVTVTPTRFGSLRVVAFAGCFALRKNLYEEVGGYDPVLRFGENTDFCNRIQSAAAELGLEVHYSFEVLTTMELGESSEHYDRFRLDSIEYLLERDSDELREQASRRARMHGIAAVNAGRCGLWGRARYHALASVRAAPLRSRNYLRVLMTLCPPLARWRWTSSRLRRRISLTG